MKLWHIEQNENTGYDTYSDAVVAARNAREARETHPGGSFFGDTSDKYNRWDDYYGRTWTNNPNKVTVTLIGTATKGTERGVICASFHAG